MLTLVVILLGIWLFKGRKKSDRDQYFRMVILGIFASFWIAMIAVYAVNIFLGPTDLAKAKEQAQPLEEKLEALLDDFSYVPEEGDSREKLNAFLEEYSTLSEELESTNLEIARNENRSNPNGPGNKIAKFFLTFGLF